MKNILILSETSTREPSANFFLAVQLSGKSCKRSASIGIIIGDKNQFKFNLENFYPINPIENLDEMSFLGGQPEYLQQEGYDFSEKYIFIGQILGMDLPEKVNEIFYLTGNVRYIFYKSRSIGWIILCTSDLNKYIFKCI